MAKQDMINTLAEALDSLLKTTIDTELANGYCLTDEESDARTKALSAFKALEKYREAAKTPKRIGISMDGGLIECIWSQHPDLEDTEAIIIDYDTDCGDENDIVMVRQASTRTPSEKWARAFVRIENVETNADTITLLPETFSPPIL